MTIRWLWAAPLIGGLVAITIISAAKFSDSTNAEDVAQAAAIQLHAEQVIGAATTTRSLVSESLLVALAVESGLAEPSTERLLVARSRNALREVDIRAKALSAAIGDDPAAAASTIGVIAFISEGDAILDAIESGSAPEAIQTESFVADSDRMIATLVELRDQEEKTIAAVRLGVEQVASAARVVVAVLVPTATGLVLALLYRVRRLRSTVDMQRRHEQQMRRVRDQFIAAMSHRLRSPLTAVVGFATTLRDSRHHLNAAERNDFVEVLADESLHLVDFIEDLLILERLDADVLRLESVEVDLRRHADQLASRWAAARLRLVTVTGAGTGLVDRERFDQILKNVLNNAADHGGPSIEIRVSTSPDVATIEVIDDGAGFQPGVDMYERYVHTDKGAAEPPRLGIGLTVCRSLIEIMAGTIDVLRDGGRTVVRLTVPAGRSLDALPPAAASHGRPEWMSVRDVVADGDFDLVFQPIFDVSSSAPVGYEALSRFRSGSPALWFDRAEKEGLRVDLELAAIRRAATAFAAAGLDGFLAVNVSDDTLASSALVEAFSGLDSQRVVLELREDVAVATYDTLVSRMQQLKDWGFRIAVDDMGTAERDLWHITRLAPSFTKLDISLVRGIHIDRRKSAIVAGLQAVASSLGSEVIAEGVEDPDELDHVRRMGIRLVQGYLLAHPQPIDQLCRRRDEREALQPAHPPSIPHSKAPVDS